jgi:hypothetical protein
MMDFGSDIETDSATESKGRKRKLFIAQSEDEDIKDEENDYEILDEEVLCVLLGLNENMGFCWLVNFLVLQNMRMRSRVVLIKSLLLK